MQYVKSLEEYNRYLQQLYVDICTDPETMHVADKCLILQFQVGQTLDQMKEFEGQLAAGPARLRRSLGAVLAACE
jgi:hypothetical protein